MRKKTAFSALLAVLGLLVTLNPGPLAAENLVPPLSGSPPLTSSFGEFRSGHYHGGLDYSTGGQEGREVRAPGDGWVYRLRASGVGYGRAVYYRLDDGRTVLLAHLSRFNPAITEALEATQDRLGRYEVDFNPPPGSLSFKAGDTLGYSGQSGAGPPHLHAEIRIGDDAAVAINPLTQGWEVSDTVPPTLTRVRIEPSRVGGLVEGGVGPLVLDLDGDVPDTVIISGGVRFWVESNDAGGGGSYRLAPHTVGCRIDGETAIEVTFDRFHWNWAREVEWTFHNRLARTDRERWICLEPPPRSRQSVARSKGLPHWARIPPGLHELTFFAGDLGGNRTEARLILLVEEPAEDLVLEREYIERTEVVSRGGFLEVRVAGETQPSVHGLSPTGEREESEWRILKARGGWICQLEAPVPPVEGLWSIVANVGARDSLIGFAVWTRDRTEGPPLNFSGHGAAGGALRMELSGEATYGPQWIGIRPEPGGPEPDPSKPELESVMTVIGMEPWANPLRERVSIALDPPRSVTSRKGLAVFSWNGGGWSYLGADTSGNGVAARIRRLERVTLLRDRVAPAISINPPGDGSMLVAAVVDQGVGVDWRGVGMTLDGNPVIAEWDPEAKHLIGYLREPLGRGDHEIVVTAADRVGNVSRETSTFSVP